MKLHYKQHTKKESVSVSTMAEMDMDDIIESMNNIVLYKYVFINTFKDLEDYMENENNISPHLIVMNDSKKNAEKIGQYIEKKNKMVSIYLVNKTSLFQKYIEHEIFIMKYGYCKNTFKITIRRYIYDLKIDDNIQFKLGIYLSLHRENCESRVFLEREKNANMCMTDYLFEDIMHLIENEDFDSLYF